MEIQKLPCSNNYDIYINNELVFNNLSILETLLQLNLLDSKVSIDLLQKYSIMYLKKDSVTIEVKLVN